jgi:hypothetical protein
MWALVYWVVAVILALAVVLLGKCDVFVDAFACFTPKSGGKPALHGRVALMYVVSRGVIMCFFLKPLDRAREVYPQNWG